MNSLIHRRISVGTLMHWCRFLDHSWSWLHRGTAVIHEMPHVPACLPACLPSVSTYVCIIWYSVYFVLSTVFRTQHFCLDLIMLCLEIWMLGADEEPEGKERNVISLSEKVEVMDKFDRGMRSAAGVLWCKWSDGTFYLKDEDAIKQSIKAGVWQGECTTGSSPVLFELCEDKVLLL